MDLLDFAATYGRALYFGMGLVCIGLIIWIMYPYKEE